MEKNFSFTGKGAVEPIVFDQIFAEKPGGGLMPNQSFDLPKGIAVGLNSSNNYAPIKAYIVYADAAAGATSVEILKGSGVSATDVIGVGGKSVAATALNATSATHDTLTVTLGVAVVKGQILYQSAKASASTAKPIYTPVYLLGTAVKAGIGAQEVKLINGANIRKESAPVANEVVELMKSIQKV